MPRYNPEHIGRMRFDLKIYFSEDSINVIKREVKDGKFKSLIEYFEEEYTVPYQSARDGVWDNWAHNISEAVCRSNISSELINKWHAEWKYDDDY